jgi:hypothetical protein
LSLQEWNSLQKIIFKESIQVGKKIKKKHNTSSSTSRQTEPSNWKIAAVVAIIFSMGLLAKVIFFPGQAPMTRGEIYEVTSAPPSTGALDEQVRLVASNFSCACGGCGELPLDECTCDMPRGAVEEKEFIRNKLKEKLSVDQVIQLLDKKYGYRKT